MDSVKTIDTPYNNAVSVLNKTNQLLLENNIKDSTGEAVAQLESTPANPAWLFALACGSLHTAWQERIAKAYSALDAQNCEDDQVLVLASIAGVKRGNGSPSHITILATNISENAVTIPIGTTFSEVYTDHTWVLNKNVSISANAQKYITLYSTTNGVYAIPVGVTFNNNAELPIACESYTPSSGGSDIESISSLRNRISQGKDATNFIIQARRAIEMLSGIESCTIWLNTSSTDNLKIGKNTSSRVNVIITNTDSDDILIEAGTVFTDASENEDWTLLRTIRLSPGESIDVVLYSVNQTDISIANGTTFTHSGDFTATCVADADSVFGSITIPPRETYISIKGYDYAGMVAETYYNYLDIPSSVGEQQEQYLLGQQPLTLNFDYAEEVPVAIYVTMKSSDMAVGAEGAVKNAISAHSGTLACGENITSQIVSEWVQNLGYGTIIDCSVGTPTGMMSNISPSEYCVFTSENIIVNAI